MISKLLVFIIKAYQRIISPFLPPACRFYPSCSSYAMEALGKHRLFKGSFLIIKRIGKCHPFHEGGVDPVP
ncbi:MAG: membrane protein insertion efficiency factor YidD [Nitrospinae bacterium]|nr:membrane protein insertion efficiency factor YidD [Nitrospinota bacterium]